MVIEKLIQVQMALFFDSHENRPDKLANKIEEKVVGVFDQMPNIIPLPSDAPLEIPRVIMQSSDEKFVCNIGNTRVDLVGNFGDVEGEIDEIFESFLIKATQFLTAVFESRSVLRFGLVGKYFIQDENLTQQLKNKYFKLDIGELDELSLRFNKKFKFREMTFNDVIDINHGILSTPNGVEIKGGFIQKDMNNNPVALIELNELLKVIESKKSLFLKEQIRGLIDYGTHKV